MKSLLVSSSQPRSVAVGDVNNDQHADFVVANPGTNNILVFISQENGTFTNIQTCSTGLGSHPRSLAINNFNNDSYADVIVANYDINSIGLFLGYGNGTFEQQRNISLGASHPLFVTAGDFNGDNHMDIAVVNNGTNTISILLGYGNASFRDPITYFTGYDSFPSSLTMGDFNNDSYLDIVVTNSGTNNILVLLNFGNGTFRLWKIYTTTYHSNPRSIAMGDLNNDNKLDIVVAHYGTNNIGVFFGRGNGSLSSQIPYTIDTDAFVQYVTLNDIDKDHALDVVIVDPQNARIYVLPGYGNGSFAPIVTYDGVLGSRPVWISIDDFNNNNQADMVVVNHGTNNVLVLMDYFVQPSARPTNYNGSNGLLAVNDFNDDGIVDVVYNAENNIGIRMGLSNSTFGEQRTYLTSEQSLPQYICTGDVNNDKRIDIIIADRTLNSVGVLLGYGNGSFGTMTSYSTGNGSNPLWIALCDLNNDHVLDIVSANYGTDSISILLGDGNGSFTLTNNYSIENPHSVTVGDINNDNHSDIIVSTDTGYVIIYLGKDDGTFIFMTKYVTSFDGTSWSISLSDLNSDNHLDIVVVNMFRDNVGVLLGYGNGTFAPQTKYSTGLGSQPYYAIVADYNNDNVSDIVATLQNSNEVVIFYGDGNGSFQLSRRYSAGLNTKPQGIATIDWKHDTDLEIVVACFGTSETTILTEYQAAEFQDKVTYSTGAAPQPTSVAIGDFNKDNRSDVVVANPGRNSLSIYFSSSNGVLGTLIPYPIGADFQPQYVITGDINRDNRIDIVSVNSRNDSISVIMGDGNGSFAKQLIYQTGDNTSPSAVAAGDKNNDNRLDLFIANSGTDSIGIFYGYDYTSFQTQQNYSITNNSNPWMLTVRDFNNDNILDIAATFYESNSWCILLGYENGSFIIAETYSLPKDCGPFAIDAGDFNNDNQVDIVIAYFWTGYLSVYFGHGNGSFSMMMLYSLGNESGPTAVAVGDFNNDSRLDIVVANSGLDNIGVFLGYGNGSFTTMMTYSTGTNSYPLSVTVGDFNNDDRLDIAVANRNSYNVAVLLGYGNGTFANQLNFSLGSLGVIPKSITVGDFNKDNLLDIATTESTSDSIGILLGYGNGSFASVRTYSTGDGSLPGCLSVGDFNKDNISDIAVTNYGTNSIIVMFGLGDGSFLPGTAYSTGSGSLPWGLGTGDFNRDGRLDIAVVNTQLNTIGIFFGDVSQPFAGVITYPIGSGSQPHSVAVGHFNNDSWLDIAVANYGTDSVAILFGLDKLHFSSEKLYLTGQNSAPYSISVSNFNNDSHWDIVVANSETDNILILFGDGTGNFTNGPTYSTGIRSRPYQVTVGDFNNDHISDLAVANSGINNVLLLYGYGNGTFGIYTVYPFDYEYQPYSIAVGDLNGDGWMDMAIACYGTDHIETLIRMC